MHVYMVESKYFGPYARGPQKRQKVRGTGPWPTRPPLKPPLIKIDLRVAPERHDIFFSWILLVMYTNDTIVILFPTFE